MKQTNASSLCALSVIITHGSQPRWNQKEHNRTTLYRFRLRTLVTERGTVKRQACAQATRNPQCTTTVNANFELASIGHLCTSSAHSRWSVPPRISVEAGHSRREASGISHYECPRASDGVSTLVLNQSLQHRAMQHPLLLPGHSSLPEQTASEQRKATAPSRWTRPCFRRTMRWRPA